LSLQRQPPARLAVAEALPKPVRSRLLWPNQLYSKADCVTCRDPACALSRRSPPRKVTYFEPVPPRLARNTIIESTFEVGRRFRCTMRVDCGALDPAT
jgi:hypothetical protein